MIGSLSSSTVLLPLCSPTSRSHESMLSLSNDLRILPLGNR